MSLVSVAAAVIAQAGAALDASAPDSREPLGNYSSPKPVTDLSIYVSSKDYPPDAMKAGQEGTTGFALTIGTDGKISKCSIEKSSGSASLDAATCRILTSRARFTPALDPEGRPSTGIYRSRIAWRLSTQESIPDLTVASFDLSADGTPGRCSMEETTAGRLTLRIAPDCGPALSAEPFFEVIRQEAKGSATRVAMEIRLIRDAALPLPVLDGPGRRVVARELAQLQISPGGQVVGCSVLEYRPLPGPATRACSLLGRRIGHYDGAGESQMRLVVSTIFADLPKP